jgi:sterol desaturase/sphingolipid hydroxylase (fatty acid hydroxylase superfamily)
MIAEPAMFLFQATLLLEGVILVLLPIEVAWLAWRRQLTWIRIKEMLASAGVYIPIIAVGGVYLAVIAQMFSWVGEVRPWPIPTSAWTAVLCLLATDFVYYWEHRLEHRLRGLWALYHSVHHSSPVFDQTTSLRVSVIDLVLTSYFYLPLILIGFDPILVAACLGVVIGYQTWIHTEMIGKLGWFDLLFNSPSNHRVHHGTQPQYLDRNFGAMLIIWDRMFGTYQPEAERPAYGLTEQIDSRNPLTVHIWEIRRFLSDWRASKSLTMGWRLFWREPGRKPEQATSAPVPRCRAG